MQYHLAPLYNISCWAFRAACAGATDSYTEMIDLNPLLGENPTAWDDVDTFNIPHQRQWVQILVNNPVYLAKFPAKLQQFQQLNPDRANIYGININAGCPSPGVIQAGQGAALIKRITRIKKLLDAFLKNPINHTFKISVKLRLGLNLQELNNNIILDTLETIASMEDPRISPPIIHFKHAEQTSEEPERWELLEAILDLQIPIIINGGIMYPKQLNTIKQSLPVRQHEQWNKNIKGIMIGRAAMKDLNIFSHFSPKVLPIQWKTQLQQNLYIHSPATRMMTTLHELYKL
jgi:tRNA-dihydrouridine synthase